MPFYLNVILNRKLQPLSGAHNVSDLSRALVGNVASMLSTSPVVVSNLCGAAQICNRQSHNAMEGFGLSGSMFALKR
jgi:hypothetical protein